MARRQTYGERMAQWEEEQEHRNWNRCFYNALECKDYARLEGLIVEGLISDYEFPIIYDEKALELIKKHKH